MANGDIAAAAGIAIVPPTAKVKMGYDEINRALDTIVTEDNKIKAAVVPVAKGGTGSTTAPAARTALGVTPQNIQAIENSGAYWTKIGYNGVRLQWDVPGYVFPVELANLSDIAGGSYLPLSGGTVTGQIYLPNSTPASSGYTQAYINSDGRISRGASSRRYKRAIRNARGIVGMFIKPLREFILKADETDKMHVGYVAEELVGTPLERFVVVVNGKVESIDYIELLLAQVAELNARVKALEAG
jgi:hypothetical protein